VRSLLSDTAKLKIPTPGITSLPLTTTWVQDKSRQSGRSLCGSGHSINWRISILRLTRISCSHISPAGSANLKGSCRPFILTSQPGLGGFERGMARMAQSSTRRWSPEREVISEDWLFAVRDFKREGTSRLAVRCRAVTVDEAEKQTITDKTILYSLPMTCSRASCRLTRSLRISSKRNCVWKIWGTNSAKAITFRQVNHDSYARVTCGS